MSIARLRAIRTGVAALIVLDLVVLLAFSVSKHTVTRTTTQPLASTPTTSASVAPSPSTSSPVPTIPPAGPIVFEPPPAQALPTLAPPPSSSTPPPTSTSRPPTHSPPPPPAGGDDGDGTPQVASCPIKLTDAKPPAGGLQSLISLAPAFGEFSAEAFAMASAYQPLLQLLGPILAQYPKLAPTFAPFVTPFVSLFAKGANALFALISPIYSPYRTRILDAETALAAHLAPYAQKLATSPLGGCLVALETALVADA